MFFITENNIPRVPGPSREEWISIKECLPILSGEYACLVEINDELFGTYLKPEVCHFNINSQSFVRNGEAAHAKFWIPLPNFPILNHKKL